MAQISIRSAAERYARAKKALTMSDRPLSPDQRRALEDVLARRESDLLEAVGTLISKKVTASERDDV